MNKILKFLTIFLLTMISVLLAENGVIAGRIVDSETGESLLGANVIVEELGSGAATDLDGAYRIYDVPAGTYTLKITYIGYQTKKVSDIVVKAGEVYNMNIVLTSESLQMESVVVTAKSMKNTEAALLKHRQKSRNVSDAISAEGMSEAGLGTAAEAMKKITGASVVDGKYVYVRGLGDRYTSTSLNGAEIPSADPYTRSGTIDIVPSNLIDNVITTKSFTPDKPGNFSGGNVDIKTKDFPDKFNLSFSSSLSYNSTTNLKKGLVNSDLGSSQLFGYDNGSLDVPSFVPDTINYIVNPRTNKDEANYLESLSDAFSHNMISDKKTLPPVNQKYSFSIGNQTDLFGRALGFIASAMYNRKYSGYQDGTYARWALKSTADQASGLQNMYNLRDDKTTDNVLLGINLKTSYKLSPKNIISFTTMYNQNGISTSRNFVGSYPYDLKEDELYAVSSQQYKERKLTSYQLNGRHQFDFLRKIKLEWQTTYAKSMQNEPDLRYMTYSFQPGETDTTYNVRSNIPQERYFRDLTENRMSGNYNIVLPVFASGADIAKIKLGSSYAFKDRDFNERRFVYEPPEDIGSLLNDYNGDFEQVFTDENLGLLGSEIKPNGKEYYDMGIAINETNQQKYNYTGEQFVTAHYLMADFLITSKLRCITGVRYENTDMEVASYDTTQPVGNVTTEDFLPSINFIYNLRDNLNLRAAYGRTLSRPSFREISPLVSYDFKEGDKFIGNADLKRTLIDNYDLRVEWFNKPGQLLAVSGFYKYFKNPIEMVIKDINYWQSWVNVPEAETYGVELELRQKLGFIHQSLNNFSLNTNASFIHSEVKRDSLELANKRKVNPSVKSHRPFQGQSPYLVNVTLSYDNREHRLSSTLYYNIFGERLTAIGKSGTPDIYEQPANTLNFSVSKGITRNINLKFSVKNIFDSRQEEVYAFKDVDYTSKLHRGGRSISLGFKYRL